MDTRNLIKRSIGVFDVAPPICVKCGAPVVELGREYATVASGLSSTNPLYGKVPYACANISCQKIMYGPSKKNPKKRCCF